MARSFVEGLYESKTITVNGKVMSIKEFNALKKVNKKKVKNKKRMTSITILPSEIKMMMKNVKVLNSLVAYHEWGYKQWGLIAKNLMNLREIKGPFNSLVVNTKQSIRLINKIEKIAKENDKDVFQYVQKLSWKLEDVKNELDLLVKGIGSSGVITRFGNHECINGTGKRLGLRILTQRGYKAIGELDVICAKLDNIEENGVDVFEYHANGKIIRV